MNSNLHDPATKGDLYELEERFEKKFATKADLKNVKSALWGQSLRVEEKVEKLEDTVNLSMFQLNKITKKLDRLGEVLDQFVGRVDELTTENQVGADHTRKLQEKAEDHEKRIKILETPQMTP